MAAKAKGPVLCGWCPAEAVPEVEVAGHPVCEVHQCEIALELRTNGGQTITPTRGERSARQEGFRRLMEAERDWQQRQRWIGR